MIAFRREQTPTQTIYGPGLKMPYEGTNRFPGYMYVDENDRLTYAELCKFVYGTGLFTDEYDEAVYDQTDRDDRILDRLGFLSGQKE